MSTRTKVIVFIITHLVLLALGVVAGWYMKPDVFKIEEKIKVVEVEKQVIVEKEKVRVEIVRVTDKSVVERWRRESTETQLPDGTLTKKTTEEKNIDTIVKDVTTNVKVVEVEKQVVVERQVQVDKIIKIDPVLENWSVSLLAGIQPRLIPQLETDIVLGVQAERRIAGPFWGGIWAQAVTPSQFNKINGIQGGISAGIKF